MATRPKKRMAKAGLERQNGHHASEQKRILRRAVGDQKEIAKLCAQLQYVSLRADQKLAEVAEFLEGRGAKLRAVSSEV